MIYLMIDDSNVEHLDSEIQEVLDLLTNCDIMNINKHPSFKIEVWFPTSKGTKSDVETLLFEYKPYLYIYRDSIIAEKTDMDITTAIDFLQACKKVLKFFNKVNATIHTCPNENRKFILYTDGASKGNPGKGGCGFVIEENNKIIETGYFPLGIVTNNVAEYEAVIKGLEKCLTLGAKEVELRSDSKLIIGHLKGEYKVRSSSLNVFFQKARNLCTKFSSISFTRVSQESDTLIMLADELANKGVELN